MRYLIEDKQNEKKKFITIDNVVILKQKASFYFPESKCIWIFDNKKEKILQRINGKWEDLRIKW